MPRAGNSRSPTRTGAVRLRDEPPELPDPQARAELVEALRQQLAADTRATQLPSSPRFGGRAYELFQAWDTTGSGRVSRHEFRQALRQLRLQSPSADRLFLQFDRDSSGTIDYHELVRELMDQRVPVDNEDITAALRRSLAEQYDRVVDLFHRPHMQQIDACSSLASGLEQPYERPHRTTFNCRPARGRWDVNGDGIVSRREFVRGLRALGLVPPGTGASSIPEQVRAAAPRTANRCDRAIEELTPPSRLGAPALRFVRSRRLRHD